MVVRCGLRGEVNDPPPPYVKSYNMARPYFFASLLSDLI